MCERGSCLHTVLSLTMCADILCSARWPGGNRYYGQFIKNFIDGDGTMILTSG